MDAAGRVPVAGVAVGSAGRAGRGRPDDAASADREAETDGDPAAEHRPQSALAGTERCAFERAGPAADERADGCARAHRACADERLAVAALSCAARVSVAAMLRRMSVANVRARLEKRVANALMRLPRSWMVKLAGGRRWQVEDFVIDEQVQLAIAMHARLGKKHTHQLSVEDARRELEAASAIFAPRTRDMAHVEERKIPGPAGPIPVRVYRPKGLAVPAPALVFFHGGGFALGSLDSHDGPCRVLGDVARCIVVAVDYRLAPEHKFPAAVDDALAAFLWVAREGDVLGVDRARVAVGGDSAGGNLSAVVAQLAHDAGLEARKSGGSSPEPVFQLLIYPATDMTMSHPSHRTMGTGFFLEHETMIWFRDHYLNEPSEMRDPRASPLFRENLSGLAPAFVATAGFDPLRDEGKAYADKLAAAGVPVRHRCYRSLFHGFFSTSGTIEAAGVTLLEAAAALREGLRSPNAAARKSAA